MFTKVRQMPREKLNLRDVLRTVGLLLGALAEPLLPWYRYFYDFQLISDYYQPGLNGLASIGGFVTFLTVFGICKGFSQERLRNWLVRTWLPILGGSLLICLLFSWTVDVVWAPGVTATLIVRALWLAAYLAIFISISAILCKSVLLIGPASISTRSGEPEQDQRSPPTGRKDAD